MLGPFFYLDGECCREYYLRATCENPYTAPKPSYETIEIYGSNRIFRQENGRFEPIKRTYEIYTVGNLAANTQRVRDWIVTKFLSLDNNSYVELSDTYSPNHYYRAYEVEGLDSFIQAFDRYGSGEISFTCDGYRYLKAGVKDIRFPAGETRIFNPTRYTALPYVTSVFTNSFDFSINGHGIVTEYIGVDSEITIDAEYLTVNAYGVPMKYTQSGDFPILQTGENVIVSSQPFDIRCRWREI